MIDDHPQPAFPPRARPLPLQVGEEMVVLMADDVNRLLESVRGLVEATYESLRKSGGRDLQVSQHAIDELESLGQGLATAGEQFSDPPLVVDDSAGRLLKRLLSDISGYQRGELTPGLVDLREHLFS